jgi:hypothetical protein
MIGHFVRISNRLLAQSNRFGGYAYFVQKINIDLQNKEKTEERPGDVKLTSITKHRDLKGNEMMELLPCGRSTLVLDEISSNRRFQVFLAGIDDAKIFNCL